MLTTTDWQKACSRRRVQKYKKVSIIRPLFALHCRIDLFVLYIVVTYLIFFTLMKQKAKWVVGLSMTQMFCRIQMTYKYATIGHLTQLTPIDANYNVRLRLISLLFALMSDTQGHFHQSLVSTISYPKSLIPIMTHHRIWCQLAYDSKSQQCWKLV